MAKGSDLQSLILNLESGQLAGLIQRFLLALLAISIGVVMVFLKFQNFGTAEGFDQAQISREIARGNGFSTKALRPVDLDVLAERGEAFRGDRMPELRSAPLYPFVSSLVFQGHLEDPLATPEEASKTQLVVDRMLVLMNVVFFFGLVIMTYLITRRLFDKDLALFVSALLLFADILWEFSLSNFPQMLTFFLFSVLVYFLVRALEADGDGEKTKSSYIWMAAAGLMAGLTMLAHNLALWPILGLAAFIFIFFKHRLVLGPVFLLIALLVVSPWLLRNLQVSGSVFGLGTQAFYESLEVDGPQTLQRQFDADYERYSFAPIRKKVLYEFAEQLRNLWANLGFSIVAPVFFLALLHPFKRRETNLFKWAVFLALVFMVIGMALFTREARLVEINQLHTLLLPLFTIYGLAFLVVLFNRGVPSLPPVKFGAIVLVLFICAYPLVLNLLTRKLPGTNWPPYFPPTIVQLNEWIQEDEVIITDIPFAVAYHADRYALMAPANFRDIIEIADLATLGMDVGAVYLTPATGDKSFVSEVILGTDPGWNMFYYNWMDMFRTGQVKPIANFPLDQMRILAPQFRTLLLVDSLRWDQITNQQLDASPDERELGLDQVPAPFPEQEEEEEEREEGERQGDAGQQQQPAGQGQPQSQQPTGEE
jgi:hypothetical protein